MEGSGSKWDWEKEEAELQCRLYKASAKLEGNAGANIAHQHCLCAANTSCLVQSLGMNCTEKGISPASETDPDVTEGCLQTTRSTAGQQALH